jgi:hypothetical protein
MAGESGENSAWLWLTMKDSRLTHAMTCEFLARSERMCALNQGLDLACAPGPCGR